MENAKCNLQQRVLLRYGTQELTSFDEKECLRQVSERRYRWRLEENVDTEGLVDWTQGMLDGNQDLLSEMAHLDASITGSEALPDGLEHRFCALHRIQFYVFLHIWSILKQDYAFFVSSKFLLLAAERLREEKNYDVLAAMHRYCYLIWLHRTDDPKIWSDVSMRVVLPDSADWRSWWEQQQVFAQNIEQRSFSEEYLIMVTNPFEDEEGHKARVELKHIKDRLKRSEMPAIFEMPARSTLHEHDVYHDAADALSTPRALPVFRCSAACVNVLWGNGDGQPMDVTRDNIVTETHCCLVVDVPVPLTLTLQHVVGTRDWKKSFEEIRMPPPYWTAAIASGFSAGAASGSSAGASASASGSSAGAPATAVATQVHLQALGAEIMATLRPDNVMHPHLRAHVEFMLGVFASVHLVRRSADQISLVDFLAGCGVRVTGTTLSEDSWVNDNYERRHENPESVVRPVCNTMWGEKTRPIAYPVDGGSRIYLVHDVCPFAKCELHKQVLGFGVLCCHWHAFNKKHGNMCTLAAQRYLKYQNIGEKGRTTRTERTPQYFKNFLERLQMVAPVGTTADDADDRVLLIGLPRWLPAFKSNLEVEPGTVLVPYHGRTNQCHFLREDVQNCRYLRSHCTDLYDALVKLLRV